MTKQEAIEYLEDYIAPPRIGSKFVGNGLMESVKIAIECIEKCIEHEETFEWCTDCKEYDQENHCCYRWSKRIRETAKENEEFYTEKMDKIKFICNCELGDRQEICDKILAVIDGSDNE